MTDPTSTPPSGDEPTGAAAKGADDTVKDAANGASEAASSFIDTIRHAFDDLAEKATPAVREASARAAELTSAAATKAVPLARKAGEATADASGKLAVKSQGLGQRPARDRASHGGDAAGDAAHDAASAASDAADTAADTVSKAASDAAEARRDRRRRAARLTPAPGDAGSFDILRGHERPTHRPPR